MGMYPLSLLESRVAAQGMELCIDSRKATPVVFLWLCRQQC